MNVPLPTKSLSTASVPIESSLELTLAGYRLRVQDRATVSRISYGASTRCGRFSNNARVRDSNHVQVRDDTTRRICERYYGARTQNPCTASVPISEYADKYLLVKPRTPTVKPKIRSTTCEAYLSARSRCPRTSCTELRRRSNFD